MALKVIHVSESNEWSGGAAQLLALAEGLKTRGWEVLIGCRPGSGLHNNASKRGFETATFALAEDYDLLSAWKLGSFVRDRGIGVVHAHHNRSHAVCLLAKALLRLRGGDFKLVVSRRVSFPPGKNPFSAWKYRSKLIDRIVAVADAVKDVLVRSGVPASRVDVIRSGVDESRFAPRRADAALKAKLGLPDGVPIVGKVANASPWKGQPVFLEAAALLKARGRKARFVLAGRDTDGPWVKEHVERLGVGDVVTLLGFRTDVPDVLACLDVSVNAAVKGEGLSGALRESLTMGVPVIASDVAGSRELLADGGGWMFPGGDAKALADRIEWCLDHAAETKAAVEQWRAKALSGFTLAQTIEKTDQLYRALLGRQ